MSQVLVGEIVFKMKADADQLIRSLKNAESQVRKMDNQTEKMTAELKDAQQAMDKVTNSAQSMRDELDKNSASARKSTAAMRDGRMEIGRFAAALGEFGGKIARTLKIPALVTAATLATAAVGAMATAAMGLGSALVPLAGLLAAYPGLFLAIGSSMALLKSAMGPVGEGMKALASGDIGKATAAMAKMNPVAAEFTRTLFRMKEAMGLQDAASQGLFPGLIEGLKGAAPLMSLLRSETYSLGKVLGSLGKDFGKMLGGSDATGKMIGYNRFYRDTQRLGSMNQIVVGNLGKAFIGLVDALRSVMSAAAPLLIWLSNGAKKMGEWAAATTSANRANGRLAGFFARTAMVAETLGSSLKNIIGGLSGISKAGGSAMGFGFLETLERATARFKEFTNSADGQNKIGRFFREAAPAIREFGLLLGDVVKAAGRLVGNDSLAKVISDIRTKLVPAVESLANGVTSRLGPALVNAATAFVNFQNVLSFTPLVLVAEAIANLVNGLAFLIGKAPGLGFVVASLLAVGAALKVIGAGMAFVGLGGQFAAFSNGLKFLGSAALITARSMGILKVALLGTGIGAAIVGIGSLFAAFSKMKEDSKARSSKIFEVRTNFIRSGNMADGDYARAMEKDLARLQQIKDKAEARAKTNPRTETRGSGFGAITYTYKPEQVGAQALRDELQRLTGVRMTEAEAAQYMADAGKEARTVAAESTIAAQRQKDAFELLTGANYSLGIAWQSSGRDASQLVEGMTAVAKATYDAVMETGDLTGLYSGAEGGFAGFKQAAQKTLDDANRFSSDMQKAMEAGYDPALIVDLATKGPATAGPLLNALVKNASDANIKFFNTYSANLRKIANVTAENARLMKVAVDQGDDSLTGLVGDSQAINLAFENGATSVEAISKATGIARDDVFRIISEFGQKRIIDVLARVNFDAAQLARLNTQLSVALDARDFAPPSFIPPGFKAPPPPKMPQKDLPNSLADGGVLKFFAGGGFSREMHNAIISRGGTHRIWSEPETGGEAYIPLSVGKRARSMAIWKQTGMMLGADMSTGGGSTVNNINVNAQTNADPAEIAREAAWQFRGSN